MPQAIVIKVGEQPIVKNVDDIHEELGGWIEATKFPNPERTTFIWTDEDGKMKGLEVNELATQLCNKYDVGFDPEDVIVGTAIIMCVDVDGENHDVSHSLIREIVKKD